MATVTSTLQAEIDLFGYQGIGDLRRTATALPRGEIRAQVRSGNVAATAAGDNQRVDIDLDVPAVFAYVLVDCWMRMFPAAGNTNNFGDRIGFNWQQTGSGTVNVPFALEASGSTIIAGNIDAKYYSAPQGRLPKLTLIPRGGDPQLLGSIYNPTANDVAYTVDYFARLLIIDISQAFHVEVNSASPVR